MRGSYMCWKPVRATLRTKLKQSYFKLYYAYHDPSQTTQQDCHYKMCSMCET